MIKKLLILATVTLTALTASAEKLVIAHTNDTHSQIDPAEDGLGGVARRKVLIDSIRAAADNSIIVDAGDIVQGTLFFNIYKGEVEEKLMNAMGYDLRILGNHEFDNGLEKLAENLEVSEAELLAFNYLTEDTPLQGYFSHYTIREYDGKKIAFLPVNLNPAGMISTPNYKGMGYVDAIESANALAWYLKNIEGADYVVAVTHIGYDPSEPPGDVELVRSSKDIDLVIGGHSHTYIDPSKPDCVPYLVKNAQGREILIAQTGKGGRYLGEITIDLDSLEKTPVSRLIPVDSRLDQRTDGSIEAIIAPYRAEVDRLNSKKVARTDHVLEKDGAELLNFSSDFVAARGRQLADGVDFAILNKGGLRNPLPKGDVTEGQIITLMPFFNRVQVIDLKGDKVLEAFDIMARADGNGVSKEVEAVYDPATKKCTSVLVNGRAVDPEKTYRIASIDYLVEGGDYMTPLTDGETVAISDRLMFEDMLDYLRSPAMKGRKIASSPTPRMHK